MLRWDQAPRLRVYRWLVGSERDRGGLARTAAELTITTSVGIVLVFLTSVAVARALGPDQKGVYDLMSASASMGALILGLSLPAGITFAVARDSIAASAAAWGALVWGLGVAAVSVVVLSLFHDAFAAIGVLAPSGGVTDLAVIAALAGVSAASAMLRAALAGSGRVELGARLDLLARASALGATILLAPGATPAALVLALVIGGLIGSGAQAIVLRPARNFRRTAVSDITAYSIQAHAANVLQVLNYRLDLFLVGLFRGPYEVGLYALAATLGQLVWVLSGSVAASLFPAVAAEAQSSRSAGRTAVAARVTFALSAAAALAGGLLALPGIRVVYGPDFAPSVVPLLALLPGVVMLAPTRVIAAYFAGVGRPNLNLAISALSFVTTVGLDLLLIPGRGMIGAAVASTASYGIAAIAGLILFRRISGVPIDRALVMRPQDLRTLASAVRTPRNETSAGPSEDR